MIRMKFFIWRPVLFSFVYIMAISSLSAQSTVTKDSKDSKTEVKQFRLPPLPYAQNALEPVISDSTIYYHYGKHLHGYINNLNNLIVGTSFENIDLEKIVKESRGAIFNNAAQVWNHQIYFNTFSPKAKQKPTGNLLAALEKQWGSFDNFKKEFSGAANSIFGSGWAWLAKDKSGKLLILKESNAGNPLTYGYTALLGIDVWEHSYYLDYRNRRADHIDQLWKIIDWTVVESRYK